MRSSKPRADISIATGLLVVCLSMWLCGWAKAQPSIVIEHATGARYSDDTINTSLTTQNVVIQTDTEGAITSQPDVGVSWCGDHSLTLTGNDGVHLLNDGISIQNTSGNGSITINALGGSNVIFDFYSGVSLNSTVTSPQLATDAGDLIITSNVTEATGSYYAIAVNVINGGLLSSNTGNILITGDAATTTFADGVWLEYATVTTTGTSSNDGRITIEGKARSAGGQTLPVYLEGMYASDAALSTGTGNILISGTAEESSAGGSCGVFLSGDTITSTVGSITVRGTAGSSSGDDDSPMLRSGGVVMMGDILQTVTQGDITISGSAKDSAGMNAVSIGVDIGPSVIGAHQGNITITGTAGDSEQSWSVGTLIDSSYVCADQGNIAITGTAGNCVYSGAGVAIYQSTVFTGQGNLDVSGSGENSDPANYGVILSDSALGTFDGTVNVSGSVGAATSDQGVLLTGNVVMLGNSANGPGIVINTGCTVSDDGTVLLQGLGGSGQPGVFIDTWNLTKTSGAVEVYGTCQINALTVQAGGGAYDVAFVDGGTIGGNTTFNNTGRLTLCNDTTDNITFTAGLTAIAPSSTYAAGTLSTVNAPITLGQLTLTGSTTITSDGSTIMLGAVGRDASAPSATGLTVNAGAGNLIVGGAITLPGGRVSLTLGNSLGTAVSPIAIEAGDLAIDSSINNGNVYVSTTGTYTTFGVNAGSGNLGITIGNGNVLTLTSAVTANDATLGGNGTYRVEGTTNLTGMTTVDALATLGGTGTFSGSVTVNGSVAPGNSIGTLHITKDYIQAAGSTYNCEINSSGESDFLDVTGSATLNGGTVRVLAASGGYGVKKQLKILESGSLSGTFSSVIDDLACYDSFLTYLNNEVWLTLTLQSFAAQGANPNQVAVGQALDQVIRQDLASGDMDTILTSLAQQPRSTIQSALGQMGSQLNIGSAATVLQAGSAMRGAVLTYLGVNRRTARGIGAGALHGATTAMAGTSRQTGSSPGKLQTPNLASGFMSLDPSLSSVSMVGVPSAVSPHRSDRDELWAMGVHLSGALDETPSTAGFDYSGNGFVLGRTWKRGSAASFGLHAGYVDGTTKQRFSNNRVGTDTYRVGGHASWNKGSGYVDGVMDYCWSRNNSSRTIGFTGINRTTSAQFDGDELSAYVEGGYVLPFRSAFVQPQLGLLYRHFTQDGYTENGAGALDLTVARTTLDSYQTSLGMRLFKRCKRRDKSLLVPDLVLRWAHEIGDIDMRTAESFVGTNTTFVMTGRRRDRDSLQGRVGVTAYTTKSWDLDFSYNGEWSKAQRADAVVAWATYRW